MRNLFLTLICPTFVFVSGLVSCSPEKKTTVDVYNPRPPQIKTAAGKLNAKDWDGQPSKKLGLQDSLDFSDARPAHFSIRTQCRMGEKNFYASFNFTGATEAMIFQIVPDEVLVSDLLWLKTECSFEMNLFNGSGSNHIFNLSAIPILDEHQSPVRVEHEPATSDAAKPLRLSFSALQDVRVRFDNTNTAFAEVICSDATFATLPFTNVVDLGSFDFHKGQLRPERAADILRSAPEQNCRARILEGGRPAQISEIFHVLFPLQALTATVLLPPLVNMTDEMGHIEAGQPVVIAEWTISNPEKVRRYFRIPNPSPQVNVVLFATLGNNPPTMGMVFPESGLQLRLVDDLLALDSNLDSLGLSIAPEGQLHLRLTFQGPGYLGCSGGVGVTAISFENFDPLVIEEISAGLKPLSQLELKMPTSIFLAPANIQDSLARLPRGPAHSICMWPRP